MWNLICTTEGCPDAGTEQQVPVERKWYTCNTCGAIYNRD